jgi:hypothetical protein
VFYYTTAGYSFDAMLDSSNMKIGLIIDRNMNDVIRKNLKRGVAVATHRYSESNNKYLFNGYDPSKGPPVYNIHLDFNSLYATCMMDFPYAIGEYEWLVGDEFDDAKRDILSVPRDSEYGYILLVDLHYSPELHDEHNDMPFCVEKLKIGKTEKLVPNLRDKEMFSWANFSSKKSTKLLDFDNRFGLQNISNFVLI